MTYTVDFTISDKNLQQLLETEYSNLEKPRFQVTMSADKLHITASDAKALKGALFSIVHTIETHEKIEATMKND